MKLKKAVSLCMQVGNLNLFDHTDEYGAVTQWLSDGRACYPLCGMPYLDEDTVCTVFDIPEKKQEKMMIRRQDWPKSLRVDDYDGEDKKVEPLPLSINYGGHTVLPMLTRGGGITYIQKNISRRWRMRRICLPTASGWTAAGKNILPCSTGC